MDMMDRERGLDSIATLEKGERVTGDGARERE
jgi:hypothetical protein